MVLHVHAAAERAAELRGNTSTSFYGVVDMKNKNLETMFWLLLWLNVALWVYVLVIL
jgi:hypothetical protein